jgi:hypothetical protein
MSKIIKEEIKRISYLFEYKRGVVISEQPQIVIDDTNDILKQNPGSFLTTNEGDNLEVIKKESNRLAKEKSPGKKIENLYYKVTQKGSVFKIYRIDKVYEEPSTDVESPETQPIQNTEPVIDPSTQTQEDEEEIGCDAVKFMQKRPKDAISFYNELKIKSQSCGSTCINLTAETPEGKAEQYFNAGNESILCNTLYFLDVDENEVFAIGSEERSIINELLSLCKSSWRFEGNPLKIKDLN